MLATKGDSVPGAGWTHEVKWDGMRVLVERRSDDRARWDGRAPSRSLRVYSRNENDVTVSFPELHSLADALSGVHQDFLIDGEVVALGEGVPSFGALADRMHVRDVTKARRLAHSNPVTLIAFDLLRLDGEDLCALPLWQRRERLLSLELDTAPDRAGAWQVPPAYDDGAMLLDAAQHQGLEGIVSKRLSSPYRPGVRSRDWRKFPLRPTRSFVVGGFRYETGSTVRLGAVLVGQLTSAGLLFHGRVGSGIAGKAGRLLAEVLAPLVTEKPPFSEVLPRVDRVETVWVRPRLVVDVQYLGLTPDGRLRQPAFRGIRTDLGPGDADGG